MYNRLIRLQNGNGAQGCFKGGKDMAKAKYNVYKIPFNDREHFKPQLIATCDTYKLAKCVIVRCNTSWHGFEIKEVRA